MNSAQIFMYAVLGGGVIALAVQYGIAKGREEREQRIERQRGAEIKTLLEHVAMVWRNGR